MRRHGFTLVELLVAIAIILVMVTLASIAASAARTSARITATRGLIEQLNSVLVEHIAACETQIVDLANKPSSMSATAYRAWYIRRNLINGDMPDRWDDVEYMATPANGWVPQSAAQRTYIAIWQGLSTAQKNKVRQKNSSAECLFMAVMRGGLGNCLTCRQLQTARIDDTDRDTDGNPDPDGFPEFVDAWGNPICYLLWAPSVEVAPALGQPFFTGSRALDPNPFPPPGSPANVRPTLGMRPLVYSNGPDGKSGMYRGFVNADPTANEKSLLSLGPTNSSPAGLDCGNPYGNDSSQPGKIGGPALPSEDLNPSTARADNVTNFDEEAKR